MENQSEKTVEQVAEEMYAFLSNDARVAQGTRSIYNQSMLVYRECFIAGANHASSEMVKKSEVVELIKRHIKLYEFKDLDAEFALVKLLNEINKLKP